MALGKSDLRLASYNERSIVCYDIPLPGPSHSGAMRETAYLDRKIETASLREIQKLQEAKLAKQLDSLFADSLFYQEKFPGTRKTSHAIAKKESWVHCRSAPSVIRPTWSGC